MISKLKNYLLGLHERQKICIALAKGAVSKNARNIVLATPESWEFSGFSQNGEDGIIDVLRSQLSNSNRYFIEIGSADGIENNTGWLTVAEKYNGIMIEGSKKLVESAARSVAVYSIGVECVNLFVTKENVEQLKLLAFHLDPDIFSLDIDGNDYYIAQELFNAGFRPKIFVVEYNSVYGPERSVTVEYKSDFNYRKEHETELYYGVSITAWRKFFENHGYRFVTVDRNGVNAFFVDPQYFDSSFLDGINGVQYAENRYQFRKFRKTSNEQFLLIKNQKFVEI